MRDTFDSIRNSEFFQSKKNIIILAVLILALPVGIFLITQQQIFRSRADVEPIVFTGDNVKEQNGKLVAIKPDITLKLTATLDKEEAPAPPAPEPPAPPKPPAPEPDRVTASITANPTTITAGHATTVSWSSTKAAKCILDFPQVTKEVDTSGSEVFRPSVTTTYGFRCEAPGLISSSRETATVTVNPPLPCTDKDGASCTFDTRTMYYETDGARIESITAYGRYWNFKSPTTGGWETLEKSGDYLTTVLRYRDGPCAGRSGGDCTFDTRNIFVQNDGRKIETITAYGKYWNFDSSTGWGAMDKNGSDLTSEPRYRDGPCAGHSSCTFDTRTMYYETDGARIESITAYGRYWNFKSPTTGGWETLSGSGDALNSKIDRYINGPCSGQSPCTFDSRTMLVKDGKKTESITAYGKYWNFDSSAGWGAMSGNGSNLSEESRYR